jgi:membrane peptidoglycan carboxypeptidase
MPKNHSWKRRLVRFSGFLLLFTLVLTGVLYYEYEVHVVEHPGKHLERSDIMRRISRESPVFYRDGRNKIGVFFGAEHREYVKFDELPEAFVHAIVASEDKNFFTHPGFDIMGILRALVSDIKARRIVAGGSTITQQTAKNLYYRSGRTLSAKLEELVNALRLEARYSKKEILEFYVNQFHVYSNGRGVGIAARYFFDKDVKQLSVLECAFLAGVVKGPFRYNPFVGKTPEKRTAARARALRRTHYVLERMAANGYLTEDQLKELMEQQLHFKKGAFRYAQNVILDYVFDQLTDDHFRTILEEHDIDNPALA